MRDICYFKRNGKCTFPKLIKFCCICRVYLPNEGDLKERLPFMQFVVSKNLSNNSFYISIIALIVSFSTLIVHFIKLITEK